MNRRDKIVSSIAVAAFFALTAFVFAPGHLFLTNAREFNANYFGLLGNLLLIALPIFVLVAVVLSFFPEKFNINQKAVALLFALSFLLWLKGNYLVWNYGLLTGNKIDFNIYFLIFDAVVWIAAIIFILIKSAFFYRHIRFLSCVFIAVQIIATSVMVYNQPDLSNLKRYEIDETNKFTFSKEKNVIILVLDTFQSDVFQKIIDEDESYRDIFEGFIYYRDALAGFPTTIASIPNILTGQYYDNSIPYSNFLEKAYLSSNSIPKVLKEAGFEVDCFSGPMYWDKRIVSNLKDRGHIVNSTILNLYDAALFRYLPDSLKRFIYNDGKWWLINTIPVKPVASSDEDTLKKSLKAPEIEFNEKALHLGDIAFANDMMTRANAIAENTVFKFYGLNGCHGPWLLNEKLQYEEMGADGYERQARASLQIAKLFLDELKQLAAFDNSMIFIIGDHGVVGGPLQSSASPLFLVKKFNGKGPMNISDAPVSLSDIPMTIFTELGIKGDHSGEYIFNLKESDSRERNYWHYDWETPGFDDWSKDYLPPIREYTVSGLVRSADNWRKTGQDYYYAGFNRPLLEWDSGGFYTLEGTGENNWRWCSSQGTLIINNNLSQDRRYVISATFTTGYPEWSILKIESTCLLLKENLIINNSYDYEKEFTVPPGRHIINFSCDAKRVDVPGDPRYMVFRIGNFKITPKESLQGNELSPTEWKGGFYNLEGTGENNWRWCSSKGILIITNSSPEKKKYVISATFFTGYPETADLRIESTLFKESLKINSSEYDFKKEITIPPGRHIVEFNCDAKRVDAPGDPRYMVFSIRNFHLVEGE